MTTHKFNFKKVTSVPSVPVTPNTFYLVALPSKPEHLEIYVSDMTGNVLKRQFNEADVDRKILESLSQSSKTVIVDNINKRNELVDKVGVIYVKDATGDSTVKSGGASYLWDSSNSTWIKISEAESLEVSLTWEALTGKPNSSATAIDQAVAEKHSHANKTTLDKLSDADDVLYFNGNPVMNVEAGW